MSNQLYILLQSLLFLACLGGSLAALAAVFRVRRREPPTGAALEPVSVLKPLCGCEPGLEASLRSYFELDHPAYELVFGASAEVDPALALARRIAAEHPGVSCRFVVHRGRGLNPKVANLRGMLDAVSHDWLVISDSNVHVGRSWLRELASVASQPGTGLAFNLIAASGDGTLGAELQALQLNTIIAAGCAIPTELLRHPAVIGKSLMFRRSLFEALGGFESVSSLLAEDYVMGRMFASAGYRVRIAPTPVHQPSRGTLGAVLARQLRWAMLRFRLQPLAYAFEPLLGPLPLLVVCLLAGRAALPLMAAAAGVIVAARDGLLSYWMRPASDRSSAAAALPRRIGWALAIGPLREVLLLGVWAAAPWLHHVQWRGQRLRLSARTHLYLESLGAAR